MIILAFVRKSPQNCDTQRLVEEWQEGKGFFLFKY